MAFVKASLKRSYAESFLAELERNENQYFFFIAKGTTWENENSPSQYTDTILSENQVMGEIIGYKKIIPQDVVFAVPRYEWISGVSYDRYDDSVELFSEDDPKQFYVVTSTNTVYKCLDNNGGAVSTVEPTITSPTPFTTSDGYRWKYLTTLQESDIPYELTDYMPIDKAVSAVDVNTVNQFNTQIQAIPGELVRVDISNASGASAGVYQNSVFRTNENIANAYIQVAAFTKIDAETSTVKITDSVSIGRIRQASVSGFSVSNYVGHAIRVEASTVNSSQVGNYGIISAVQETANDITFTVKNDVVNFIVSPSTGTGWASVEILPFINIVGDGEGAYVKPVMNTSKNITGVVVVSGGKNYNKVSCVLNSNKNAVTVHPTLRPVLSPKEGHGSNILSELNAQDVILIINIGEEQANKIIGGGSYRQYGIIKNPVLSSGLNRVAGTEDPLYRDLTVICPTQYFSPNHFSGDLYNFITGIESGASAKVVELRAYSSPNPSETWATIKTVKSSPEFLTQRANRDIYYLSLDRSPVPSFILGETVRQSVPAGTAIFQSVSYGFDVLSRGTVLSVSGATLEIRLTSNSGFVANVPGATLEAVISGVTAAITAVSPKNGERLLISSAIGDSAQFIEDASGNQTGYSVYEIGSPYSNQNEIPSYSGLYVLNLVTSANAATGGLDLTSSQMTLNSFSNGDKIVQGTTSGYTDYATGDVYYWDFVNPAYGRLYVSNVLGVFRSVQTHGLTGTTLGAFVVASVDKPEIKPNSGEILYIDNVRPIQRIFGQEEEFRVRLGF